MAIPGQAGITGKVQTPGGAAPCHGRLYGDGVAADVFALALTTTRRYA